MRNTHAIIDRQALLNNIATARSGLKPSTKLMAIIKANAYGHGIIEVGRFLEQEDAADAFGVAISEEGVRLRRAGIETPILILGASDEPHLQECIENRLSPAVFSVEQLLAAERLAAERDTVARIHLKLDTGMRRIGIFETEELKAFLAVLAQCPHVALEGVFTHFAKSENDPDFTAVQAARFDRMVAVIHEQGYFPIVHAANSGAILDQPQYAYDMVRLGISLYGYHPDASKTNSFALRPVMKLVSSVSHVKTVEAGEGISYGLRFTTERTSRIATVPLGYGDGYKRCLTNRAEALVQGTRCPVVGTVCMDQIMLDVTALPNCKVGDEVVLFGEQGTEYISADEIAALAETISYEILLSVSDRVPRVYR